jgi:RHS repeat-associated protein
MLFALAVTLFLGTPSAFADADHNPIGVSGVFEGMVTTGCAYNVLSHNARREIDDIVVPGAVGKYGLKMTRYYNTRSDNNYPMGPGWSHEYLWSRDQIHGKIDYPSGNVWDSHCTDDWALDGPLRVSDWPITSPEGYPAFRLADGGMVVFRNPYVATEIVDPYGQVTTITVNNLNVITKVTEPGGRYLKFFYEDPNAPGLLSKVEAHGLGNATVTDSVVYHYQSIVPGGQGAPPQWCLTQVDYSDGQQAHYTYQRDNSPDHPQQPCPCPIQAFPLVSGCNDVRYRGPMRCVAYQYPDHAAHGAITLERYWDGVPGNEDRGAVVSKILPAPPSPLVSDPNFDTLYTEYRGDGPTRTFTYTPLQLGRPSDESCPRWQQDPITNPAPQQFLRSYTDFIGSANSTQLGYDTNWYINSVTDANGQVTQYLRGPPPYAHSGPKGIGEVKKITYPDGTHIDYGYQPESGVSGHYLTSVTEYAPPPTNEQRSQTIHIRDANTHKISRTDYNDGDGTLLARETFTYCDQPDDLQCGPVNPTTGQMHGQIKTHFLKNRAYVHYRYDSQGRGLLIDQWEPTWSSTPVEAEPKTHYVYYAANDSVGGNAWIDRLKTKTGPPPNWPNSSQASETYEYDRALDAPPPNGITDLNGAAIAGRGLVTKITHADGKYQQFKYDAYGNKRWEDNELRKATSYTYDEYNRLVNVTRPANGITTYTYNPTNGSGTRLSHTTSNPDTVTVRTSATTNIVTTSVYDQNFRKTSSTVLAATTWFHYDAVGNQDYVTDPRGSASGDSRYTTYTDYDSRNRKSQVREPLSRTTQFYYDDGFNLTRIMRGVGTPEAATETKAYDGLNRLKSDKVPKDSGVNILTQFDYNPWSGDSNDSGHSGSLLQKVTDGELHYSQFQYDAAGLKSKMTYHDGSSQSWAYDDAHNLKSRKTVAGETQNFGYDNRNRKTLEWWDGWPADGEWRALGYDDASHLTSATNGTGAYNTNFIADVRRFYDNAGRLTLDRQTVYVNGIGVTKDVDYPTYTDDGRVTRMYVDGANPAYDYTFSYDNMGRFEKIQVTGSSFLFQYRYDPASNEIQRDNLYNGVTQVYPRDALNRMTKVELQGASSFAREMYDYYTIGRLHTVTRQDNKQDQFVFYLDGELQQATYAATGTPSPTPTPGGTPAPPFATAATNITNSGFSAHWRGVPSANGYRLDVSKSSTFENYVSGYHNLDVGNVTSRAVNGLTASTTYYYRVRAYNDNGTSGNSNVITVTTTTAGQVATPTFDPDGQDVEGCAFNYTFDVTISTTTTGAQIRWTIDGSMPSPTNGTLINGSSGVASFTISGTKTLQAMAYKTGMSNSNIKSAVYSFRRECGRQGYPLDYADTGQLIQQLVGTFNYTLDKAGNRTAVNGVNYSPNPINQYTSVGGSAVTNGPDHEIQMHSGFTYQYMRDQELVQVTAGGFTWDFAYDALGRCVKRAVSTGSTVYYIYQGDKPILEYNEGNALVGFNVYGKGIDEIVERGAYGADSQWHWYFLNQDHEGSVTHLTDADGTIIEKYRYDVFGAPSFYNGGGQISTTAFNNRFLFAGREYLGAWVYDYRARLYNASLGRFMSEDPKGFVRRAGLDATPAEWTFAAHPDEAEFNLFRYCGNDPIDFTDPMGLMPDALIAEPEGRDVAPAVVLGHAAIIGVLAAPAAEAAVGRATVAAVSRSPTVARVVAAIAAAFKGEQARNSGSSSGAKTIANPVPSTMARVIPERIPATTLGRPGAADVFVTAAKDIAGKNASQIANRLGIPQSPTGFRVFEFSTPQSGVASPVFRTGPGFIGGGLTSGGAREFVIPNGPIPPGAVIRTVP